ncbi:UDP-2,3-diacylglucosamine pyrophosphatase LpxH [Mangrovibacterium marinum]|uniref:UDP-2,3-diacylglucosamine pyrophosphatase LpxH n=2 Tax=Mangrovibacterium marinum TaxID=1639118 RepID=A0A2T5BYS2_9BACT|nr:UDP-2,3-diacylglucosamine pyrophosphatase LpxH [Mangrovibacterium marinum]
MKSRKIEIAVLSDLHLATRACKAKKILHYLKSIHPQILVLNGDIIDSWRFSRNYFPKPQLKVVRQLIKMMEKGVQIFYITGNHDEFLRRFNQTEIGKLKIVNQLILELDGRKTWIFHGDLYDHIIHKAKWLAKIGAAAYGLLTVLNNGINLLLRSFGLREVILYKRMKKKDKSNQPTAFEKAIASTAALNNYDTVICGHTHLPKDKRVMMPGKTIRYINCGDWVEHFTAAEYNEGKWELCYFEDPEEENAPDDPEMPDNKQLYQSLIRELALANCL